MNATEYGKTLTEALNDMKRSNAEMKDIKNFKIIRMRTKRDHSVLEPYEKQFNKPLGILDAIVISPLTKYEIKEIIDTYDTNEELLAYQNAENERTLQYYHENYEQD